MAPDGHAPLAPNVYDADPIPDAARAEIAREAAAGRAHPSQGMTVKAPDTLILLSSDHRNLL